MLRLGVFQVRLLFVLTSLSFFPTFVCPSEAGLVPDWLLRSFAPNFPTRENATAGSVIGANCAWVLGHYPAFANLAPLSTFRWETKPSKRSTTGTYALGTRRWPNTKLEVGLYPDGRILLEAETQFDPSLSPRVNERWTSILRRHGTRPEWGVPYNLSTIAPDPIKGTELLGITPWKLNPGAPPNKLRFLLDDTNELFEDLEYIWQGTVQPQETPVSELLAGGFAALHGTAWETRLKTRPSWAENRGHIGRGVHFIQRSHSADSHGEVVFFFYPNGELRVDLRYTAIISVSALRQFKSAFDALIVDLKKEIPQFAPLCEEWGTLQRDQVSEAKITFTGLVGGATSTQRFLKALSKAIELQPKEPPRD